MTPCVVAYVLAYYNIHTKSGDCDISAERADILAI